MDIHEFPLIWRWTSASHTILPPDTLLSLRPLNADESNRLYSKGEEIFRVDETKPNTRYIADETEATQAWLETLPLPCDEQVSIVWNRATGLCLPWKTFTAFWNNFCYPSSDDLFVFSEQNTYALAWNHEETFEFVERET